ncbi:hypothetical protein HK101_002185 [Irineochytrium annulatum]|nr:hypothetical protein HK101_002185 [Irineochytrium annulatum]
MSCLADPAPFWYPFPAPGDTAENTPGMVVPGPAPNCNWLPTGEPPSPSDNLPNVLGLMADASGESEPKKPFIAVLGELLVDDKPLKPPNAGAAAAGGVKDEKPVKDPGVGVPGRGAMEPKPTKEVLAAAGFVVEEKETLVGDDGWAAETGAGEGAGIDEICDAFGAGSASFLAVR